MNEINHCGVAVIRVSKVGETKGSLVCQVCGASIGGYSELSFGDSVVSSRGGSGGIAPALEAPANSSTPAKYIITQAEIENLVFLARSHLVGDNNYGKYAIEIIDRLRSLKPITPMTEAEIGFLYKKACEKEMTKQFTSENWFQSGVFASEFHITGELK
jgi:hypothetical protein